MKTITIDELKRTCTRCDGEFILNVIHGEIVEPECCPLCRKRGWNIPRKYKKHERKVINADATE